MSSSTKFKVAINGEAVLWTELPEWPISELVDETARELERGVRLLAWYGVAEGNGVRVVAVLAFDGDNTLAMARSTAFSGSYPSLTLRSPQAHLFERELYEQFKTTPEGHPWLKPVRDFGDAGPGVMDYFTQEGEETHEVAVGPIHAGIIEPGHFRFQCVGEEVRHLEISLGYQHRGIEAGLEGGPYPITPFQIETIAGDTTLGHTSAYSQALEALDGGGEAPLQAQWLRAIALELERLANHTGDMGALAGDVAFLPTASACGKIRGDFLNLTASICGNRFGRGIARPGGCLRNLETDDIAAFTERLEQALKDVDQALAWFWDAASVRARFDGVGVVTAKEAMDLGMVGPAARASGLARDARFDQPSGWYRFAQAPVSIWPTEDVLARAKVRSLEIERSGAFLREQLQLAPTGDTTRKCRPLNADTITVSLVEGWRGEIVHVALTDEAGKLRRYKIVDPSFRNWNGLSLALRGEGISDFPINNKSFNLSYCGFDL